MVSSLLIATELYVTLVILSSNADHKPTNSIKLDPVQVYATVALVELDQNDKLELLSNAIAIYLFLIPATQRRIWRLGS